MVLYIIYRVLYKYLVYMALDVIFEKIFINRCKINMIQVGPQKPKSTFGQN